MMKEKSVENELFSVTLLYQLVDAETGSKGCELCCFDLSRCHNIFTMGKQPVKDFCGYTSYYKVVEPTKKKSGDMVRF